MKKFQILVLSLFAVLIAAAYIGCHGSSGPVVPGDVLRYISADVCMTCHIEKGDEWKRTAHFRALPDLQASGHAASYCMPCHVTGLDDNPANSGYDDPNQIVADRFGGVQCEACHGPGGQHIIDKKPLLKRLDPTLCGQCHAGSHHSTYDDWQDSAHARAIDARDLSSHFSTECLECHSTDYRFAESVPEDATPYDFEYGITCVDCHDPHNDENPFQLRTDVVTLCASCHTSEGSVPGERVHHPHGDMFQGIGGYEYPGQTYENTAHTFIEEACAACHMWTSPFDATGQGENAISGHTWEPVIQACQECHTGLETFDRGGAQTEIQMLLDELQAELDAATDADKLTLSYERAEFNHDFVDADGTRGIHNFRYAKKLLEDSIHDFEPSS